MTRLIDADALMAQFPCTCGCNKCGQGKDGILPCDIKDKIKAAPTVEKVGKWEFEVLPKCSVCKNFALAQWDFCPNCGARMEHNTKDVPDPIFDLWNEPVDF